MLLLDDLLLSPLRGLMFLARRIDEKVQEEQTAESARLTATLADLYRELEAGRITEEDFDHRERLLLDRLERLGSFAENGNV